MKSKRVSITLTFSADLDGVPGWGHQPEDWENLVRDSLNRNSHYNTEVEIHRTKVRRYFWSERRFEKDGTGYFIPSTRIEAWVRRAFQRYRCWQIDRKWAAERAKRCA